MTGNRSRFLAVSAVVTIGLTFASWLAAQARKEPPRSDSLYKYLTVFTEVLGLVRQAYVKETNVDDLMAGAYEGAADALGPFTLYVPPEQAAEYRRVKEHGATETGLYLLREHGWLYVVGVAAGSPAEKAGFERGDLVSRVDGKPTRELQVWQIDEDLAGHVGATVAVAIVRQGDSKTLQLAVGAGSAQPTTSVSRVRDIPVLRIARFETSTVAAVQAELEKLARTHGDKLAIDLRGVAGGDVEAAYQIADLMVSGDMGTLEARDQVRQKFSATGEPVWKGRVVVLTDRATLGAAEILARVLDESADATLVGEPTFGHAGHQGQVELASGGLVELTDSFYTGPKGKPLDESIEPDQEVDERSRTLREKDLTLDELILQRGVGVLEKPPAPEQKAA